MATVSSLLFSSHQVFDLFLLLCGKSKRRDKETWIPISMELGFGGINACPENNGKNIYLLRDYTWNVLYKLFGPKKKCEWPRGVA